MRCCCTQSTLVRSLRSLTGQPYVGVQPGAAKGLCQHGVVADAPAGPDPDAVPPLPLTLDEPVAPVAVPVRARRLVDGALVRLDAVAPEWWALVTMLVVWVVV